MAESDSLSSVMVPPEYLNSKYEALDLKCDDSYNGKEHDSNSEGIVSALRALQEKIRCLENDKAAVSKKFEELKDNVGVDPLISHEVQAVRQQKIQSDGATDFSKDKNDSSKSPGEVNLRLKQKEMQHLQKYRRHYHLNFKDVPFLLGMSATASHSLFANYQQLLALMKRHGPLCQMKSSGVKYCQLSKHCIALEELSSLLCYLYDEVQMLCCEYENNRLSSHLCQCEETTLSERKYRVESTKVKLQSKLDKMLEHFQQYILCCHNPSSCIQPYTSTSDCVQYSPEIVDCMAPGVKYHNHLLKKIKQVQKTLHENDLHWQ